VTIEETITISGVFDPSPQIVTDASPTTIGIWICNVPEMQFPVAGALAFTIHTAWGRCGQRKEEHFL